MKKNEKPKLLFTERALPIILEAFGKNINSDGIIIENDTLEPVLTSDGEEIKASELGGIKNGRFIKDDLYEIMNLVEEK